jgi:PKD repeat protein
VGDPGADTVSGYTIHWGDGVNETFSGSPSGSKSHVYVNGAAAGTGRTITVDLTDEDGSYLGVASQSVTVNNVAPTVALNGPAAAAEGQTKHYTFTAGDPGADTLSVSATSGGSVGTVSNLAFDPATKAGSFDVSFADGPATSTVSVRVADSDGAVSAASTVDVGVTNVAPVIDPLVTPFDPVPAGSPSPVNVSVTFTDPGTADSFTVQWNWGDGSTANPIHLSPTDSKSLTASHWYAAPGVYTISLTVTDKDGGAATKTAASYVVVYDPSAGFVTGGGWITSPAGAYAADPTLTGKATFGFEAKYQKGTSVPSGNTQFLFATAGFEFKSTSYDWLVVAGAKAQYKGSGTINGSGDYGFILTAWDGQRTGGGGTDKLRLKVWNKVTGLVVYDNQMGATDGTDPSTALGGGSIQIHDAR